MSEKESEAHEVRLSTILVEEVLQECLGEKQDGLVIDMPVDSVAFDPAKIEQNKTLIFKMLMELPTQFRQSDGGGWSFLQACMDRHDNQWTSFHRTMGFLFALGEAAGFVKPLLPRDMWQMLPGGMPYYVILDEQLS